MTLPALLMALLAFAQAHQTRMVAVEPGVALEVLDWGGSGRPLVFLAGAGNTAHVFDEFALRFTDRYHVYGITRRGHGRSGDARAGLTMARLAEDVVAVLASGNNVISIRMMDHKTANAVETYHPLMGGTTRWCCGWSGRRSADGQ